LLSSILFIPKIKKGKRKKKGTPPWYVNVGGHLMNRLAMVCERKKGGEECQAL
jgi:hypothetical protein